MKPPEDGRRLGFWDHPAIADTASPVYGIVCEPARHHAAFEGRLEVVHKKPQRSVKTGQFGGGLQTFKPLVTNRPPDNGTIFLFHPSLIILTIGPAPRELDRVCQAVLLDRLIHEDAVIVRVEPGMQHSLKVNQQA